MDKPVDEIGGGENGRLTATTSLPANFTRYHSVNLATWQVTALVNLGSLGLLFIFGWLFLGFAAAINPQFFILNLTLFVHFLSLPAFLLTLLVTVLLHEICHGLLFWLYTRTRPRIGFNLLYAYAAAPGWYFPKWQYVQIGLAPLLLLTAVGLLWTATAEFGTVPMLVLALAINAAGSIGDLVAVFWLLSQPDKVLVQDEGAEIVLYRPM